jgi:hypothetical protein
MKHRALLRDLGRLSGSLGGTTPQTRSSSGVSVEKGDE